MQQGLHHICMQYASQFSHSPTHDHHDRVFSYICKPFCSACPSALIAKRRRTISKKLEWLWREKWQRVRFLTGLGPIAWRHSDSVDDIQSCEKFMRTWTLGESVLSDRYLFNAPNSVVARLCKQLNILEPSLNCTQQSWCNNSELKGYTRILFERMGSYLHSAQSLIQTRLRSARRPI